MEMLGFKFNAKEKKRETKTKHNDAPPLGQTYEVDAATRNVFKEAGLLTEASLAQFSTVNDSADRPNIVFLLIQVTGIE